MLGNISEIYNNKKAGLIFAGRDSTYYFNAKDIENCTIFQMEEGDQVEFDIIPKNPGTKYDRAINIRKKSVSVSSEKLNIINPGINPAVDLSHFNDDEKAIIKELSKSFYITNSGAEIKVGNSTYKYCLVKPTSYFSTMFHLSRELIVIFSDYVDFEPRSLDAAATVTKKMWSRVRLERCCHILISNDSKVESKINDLLKDTNLNSIVIPFSYYEFLKGITHENEIKTRFKNHLFDVDLFSETQPIKEDLFFFGRRDYAQDIAAKCKNNSHCGVFGLRRSGKTSLLYAVKRLLNEEDYKSVYIPCNGELAKLNWVAALYAIIKDIQECLGKKAGLHTEKDYDSEERAMSSFMDDMNLFLGTQSKPLTLMFDEIEYITFDSATAGEDWRTGHAFISSWNVIRGYCLKYPKRVSILIAGTNPTINEVPSIQIDGCITANPMYGQLAQSNQGAYLPPFDIKSTGNMVNTLGGYMGISFNEEICAKLTSDCGGHPYLIRLFCKHINNYIQESHITRPISVTLAIYEKVRPMFEKSSDAQGFYSMILLILQESFPKEYNVLKILATKDDKLISTTQDQNSLIHLLGYGLIDCNQGRYAIKFETVKRFMEGKYQFEVEGLTSFQKNAEINLRINNAESLLRKMVRQTLQLMLGTEKAKGVVIQAMEANPACKRYAEKANSLEYSKLFDPSINSGLFFSLLKDIICNHYNYFVNIFEGADIGKVQAVLETINQSRKAPAHSFDDTAEKWTEENFQDFRCAMSWLEDRIKNFAE